MGVGGAAPPAGFPPTRCRRRARRYRRELFRPRAGARGHLEARSAVEAPYGPLLLIAEAPPPIPRNEVAYTAGFFDGEGCVNIARYLKRGRPYHTLAIIFTNTDFRVLEWLQRRWGGYLTRPILPDGTRQRPYRHLRFSAGPARPLLLAMLPHLINKKSDVEMALQLI